MNQIYMAELKDFFIKFSIKSPRDLVEIKSTYEYLLVTWRDWNIAFNIIFSSGICNTKNTINYHNIFNWYYVHIIWITAVFHWRLVCELEQPTIVLTLSSSNLDLFSYYCSLTSNIMQNENSIINKLLFWTQD